MKKIEFEGTVSETLLINLYFRSKENQETMPILKDEFSGDVVSKIDYDFAFWQEKLKSRDVKAYERNLSVKNIEIASIFKEVEGEIEPWEKVKI